MALIDYGPEATIIRLQSTCQPTFCRQSFDSTLSYTLSCATAWPKTALVFLATKDLELLNHLEPVCSFVRVIHQLSLGSPHKGTVTWKLFPCDSIITGQTFNTIMQQPPLAQRSKFVECPPVNCSIVPLAPLRSLWRLELCCDKLNLQGRDGGQSIHQWSWIVFFFKSVAVLECQWWIDLCVMKGFW